MCDVAWGGELPLFFEKIFFVYDNPPESLRDIGLI